MNSEFGKKIFSSNSELQRLSKGANLEADFCILILRFVAFLLRKNIVVGDGEFHPCPNSISSTTKSEPSDYHASRSSGNGYKTIPVNKQCNKHHIIIIIIQLQISYQ